MRYELKEFQRRAASELLDSMTYLMGNYIARKKPGSCCLMAPTGSGKTIIMAEVIETIIEGRGGLGFAPDPDAAVLWVTDLPSLSEQTRQRLLDATDLDPTCIEPITNTFTQDHTQLGAGRVYFLHRQLLGRNRKLTDGGESPSFWRVLRDSIASGLHLYLVLDEAHRGLGATARRSRAQDELDQTIYARIIDGEDGDSPVPVVVGISATPQRFMRAMEHRRGRTSEGPVKVSPAEVQASGLLKDDIVLRAPVTGAAASHVYLEDACVALKDSTTRWAGWCALNDMTPVVVPLLVVQVPDKATDGLLGELVRDIRSLLPSLEADSFAHVFGDHLDRHVAGVEVPYVPPERVEATRSVRVLFAKEAISTGWDCPRAEVIYSMRPHRDATYITQLLGRMVRTPLAMRVGDEALNAVRCFLPEFDEKGVEQVIGYLTSEDSPDWSGVSAESGRTVIANPVDVFWDHSLGIDGAFESIRKVVESHRPLNEVEAVLSYTALLARYEIDILAQKQAYQLLVKEIRNGIAVFADEYQEALEEVKHITSNEYHMRYMDGSSISSTTITQAADAHAVSNARRRADGVFTEALTNRFFASERGRHKSDLETNASIAAAASVPEIVGRVKKVALCELDRLVPFTRDAVAELPESARARFASVLSANGIDRVVNLRIPEVGIQDRSHVEYVLHALSEPGSGAAWLRTDSVVEDHVIRRELKRCVAFYRNPSSGTGDHVFSIVYQQPGVGRRVMHPDFIFFEDVGGTVMPSIVDPHWTLASEEARAKLEGLARYAQEFGLDFARIWSVNGDGSRYLDLLSRDVQNAILEGDARIDALYLDYGHDYG